MLDIFQMVSDDGVATDGITTYWSIWWIRLHQGTPESSVVDVNVYQIIKTADATLPCFIQITLTLLDGGGCW